MAQSTAMNLLVNRRPSGRFADGLLDQSDCNIVAFLQTGQKRFDIHSPKELALAGVHVMGRIKGERNC